MKKVFIPLTLVFLWTGTGYAAERPVPAPTLSDANAKYAAGDFKAAAEMYEALVGSGQRTSALYYNLGNADLRAGRKGEALIAYERAKNISPRDEDIRWNLAILKSVLADKLELPSIHPLADTLKNAMDRVSAFETGAALAGAFFVLMVLAVLNLLLWPDKRWSRQLQRLAFVGLVLAGAAFAWKWNEVKDPRAVVLDKQVYARYGPSETETKAFLLHEGAEGRVLDSSKEWFYISLANGNTGWVPKASCEVI